MAIKPTKDYSNLIGGEQKYVCSTFTLESNGQLTIASKMPTWQYFLGVLVPRVCPVEENFYLIFWRRVCPQP
jgi:hypothetical protein